MASMWQKTLFYLGLVDDEEGDRAAAEDTYEAPPAAGVRTVDPPGSRVARRSRPGEAAAAEGSQPYDPPSSVAGRRVEPPTRQRRRISGNPEHAEAGVLVYESGSSTQPPPAVRNIPVSHEAVIIEARTFSDAQVLADHIRDGQPVVLDLRATEPAMVRRLVDFATGLTYALEGRMAKTAQGVILVTPAGGALAVEEQDRLAGLGLYTVGR